MQIVIDIPEEIYKASQIIDVKYEDTIQIPLEVIANGTPLPNLEALEMAIKALEQEPCDDAISRQSAIFLASDLKQDLPDDERISDMVMAHNEGILEYQTQLSLLPPVTPRPKTGHWIVVHPLQADDEGYYMCSVCRCGRFTYKPTEFCPNCGAKMESEARNENTR